MPAMKTDGCASPSKKRNHAKPRASPSNKRGDAAARPQRGADQYANLYPRRRTVWITWKPRIFLRRFRIWLIATSTVLSLTYSGSSQRALMISSLEKTRCLRSARKARISKVLPLSETILSSYSIFLLAISMRSLPTSILSPCRLRILASTRVATKSGSSICLTITSSTPREK